jgi:kumamolisin
MTSRTRLASAAVALTALAGSAVLAASPALASAPTASVTAFLRAPNAAGLARLAQAHGLTHTQRLHALARLVPSAATRSAVSKALVADGLTVSGSTAWSITAHGPSSIITGLFGQRPAPVAHPSLAQRRAETGPLPLVPAAIATYVSVVLPTTGGPAPYHHSAAVPLTGTDFRNAYTPAGTAPPGAGATDDGDSVVATLQLSTFDSADLTNYASMQDPALPNIVGTSKYHPVTVDGGTTDTSGDVEVDLDQESILTTAPSAGQRPYFAPNTEAGFNDVFANVFDDAVQNADANDGGDPHIVALSSSWGGCESGTGAASLQTTETLIQALVAAGVTVFSSSGDDGIYDCRDATGTGLGNSQADVDYPASSPSVVGVGGTNLQYTGASTAPNNGTNWNETSWTCTDTVSCENTQVGTGGTGGGQSGSAYDSGTADSFAGFPAPAYQTATITQRTFAGQPNRLVPDIAADGDPSTGFELYTSDPQYVAIEAAGDGYLQVGGTSLSSPISAALLTNTLATQDRHTGVGDIHAALYSAWKAKAGAVRDITVGSNGATGDKGTDPSVSARRGFDTNTGIGGVLWPAMVPYLFSDGTPKAIARLRLKQLHQATNTDQVTVRWGGKPGDDKLALASSSVVISQFGHSKPIYSKTIGPVSGTMTIDGTPGATYQVTVRTTDLAGTHSPQQSAQITVPIDDASFSFHGAWHRVPGDHAIAGSYAQAHQAGATAKVAGTGTVYRLNVLTGPNRGRLAVYHGNTKIKTIDLFGSVPLKETVTIFGNSATPRQHRSFTIRCLGKKAALSHGTSIGIDGLTVTY